ncbi:MULTISPECIES: TetR/AcrR family transcriptional regulator [Streptomyces]|uniref:TetR/AcrR family transcriptional regulator n=1 Tax=Streptomyces lycii TaxID=2654337 RepID=A0ABQ7FKE0_9ACTN|nr:MULTISPECIES: TetR/AcrR family transcriptional regulator [Streptomyces]KAF4407692.1 TetR/AcrR family transcriptional regulator [Streptomyces lycii]PGH47535.1 TetR family transcriptional regulator [Streptomyces sp. Ru87]
MKRDLTRERIVTAASELLAEGGRDAVSTRAVCAASGVQSPTIYRLFGDKNGLLEAVADHAFESYLARKTALAATDDPVEDLRRGWDLHVGFGLANPACYALIYGEARPGVETSAARRASAVLAGQIRRIAESGRLRVGEKRAAHLVHSAGCGMTFTLISLPEEERDPGLSALGRESVIAAVTTEDTGAADAGPTGLAVAMAALAPRLPALSAAERELLAEWMDRVVVSDG